MRRLSAEALGVPAGARTRRQHDLRLREQNNARVICVVSCRSVLLEGEREWESSSSLKGSGALTEDTATGALCPAQCSPAVPERSVRMSCAWWRERILLRRR